MNVDTLVYIKSGGGGTPIIEHGGELPLYWPPFLTFSDPIAIGSLFLCPTRSYSHPLSAEKIGLPLSHSVPEIIWPKFGLNFHKNLSFDHFEAFIPILSLIFHLIDPLFCSSYTPHFYKTSHPVGSIFSSPAPRATACLVSFHLG